ncbi:MAG: hypothetical protein II002_04110 [Bacteroidales bacterium]|nr:hypothetical protein [Bacteroidales bacterium]
MSILIKGIDIPKDGEHIIALIKNDGKVSYFEQDTETTTCKRMKEAEAIQIPTPHGRLIDADELKKRLYGYERWTGIDEVPYEYAEKEVYDAPTILEAEE